MVIGAQAPTAKTVLASALTKSGLPGMSAIIVRSGGISEVASVGVRRMGTDNSLQADDLLHFASNTKAMTATLIARSVERKQIAWSSRIADVFPDLAERMNPAFREVTLADFLNHRGGLAAFDNFGTPEFREAIRAASSGSPRQKRRNFTYWLL